MKASDIIKKPVSEDTGLEFAKSAIKKGGKYAPLGLGVGFGVADAAARLQDDDYVGAGISGLSALSAIDPGPGTAISAGLDAYNIARDKAKEAGGWKPMGQNIIKGAEGIGQELSKQSRQKKEPFSFEPMQEQELDEAGLGTRALDYVMTQAGKIPKWFKRGEEAAPRVEPTITRPRIDVRPGETPAQAIARAKAEQEAAARVEQEAAARAEQEAAAAKAEQEARDKAAKELADAEKLKQTKKEVKQKKAEAELERIEHEREMRGLEKTKIRTDIKAAKGPNILQRNLGKTIVGGTALGTGLYNYETQPDTDTRAPGEHIGQALVTNPVATVTRDIIKGAGSELNKEVVKPAYEKGKAALGLDDKPAGIAPEQGLDAGEEIVSTKPRATSSPEIIDRDSDAANAERLRLRNQGADKPFNENKRSRMVLDEDDTAAVDQFLRHVIGAESGGRNIKNRSGSSAFGLGQFMPSTFRGMVNQASVNSPLYGKTWNDYKQDTDLQKKTLSIATQNYVNMLNRNKVPVTAGSLYMSHHFGPDRAVKMMRSDPDKKLIDFFPPQISKKTGEMEPNIVFKQNPHLKPTQSVSNVYSMLSNKMGDTRLADVGTPKKKNRILDLGTDVLAAATGSGSARASDELPKDAPAKPDTAKPDTAKPAAEPEKRYQAQLRRAKEKLGLSKPAKPAEPAKPAAAEPAKPAAAEPAKPAAAEPAKPAAAEPAKPVEPVKPAKDTSDKEDHYVDSSGTRYSNLGNPSVAAKPKAKKKVKVVKAKPADDEPVDEPTFSIVKLKPEVEKPAAVTGGEKPFAPEKIAEPDVLKNLQKSYPDSEKKAPSAMPSSDEVNSAIKRAQDAEIARKQAEVITKEPESFWDKGISTITGKPRLTSQDYTRTQVPESINTELADILWLAGKAKKQGK